MSYILEALKKLEQKRRSGETSQLVASQPSVKKSSKSMVLQYSLLAVLLVNAFLLLWWLHPWRPAGPAGPASASVSASPVAKNDDVLKQTKSGKKTEDTRSVGLKPDAMNKPGDKLSAASVVRPENISSQPVRPLYDYSPAKTKVIGISELPLSVSQRLPDLTISGHFYDRRASSRVITIGGRMLHEGASAAPGVKLEMITQEGAVFSFEGYRFRKGVF